MAYRARSLLSRIAPAMWVLAGLIVGLHVADPDYRPEAYLMVLFTGLATAGTVCAAVRGRRDEAIDLLLSAILDEEAGREDLRRRLGG